MSKLDDLTRLRHIQDAGNKAMQFIANRSRDDLDKDEMLSLALVRLLEIIGEAANHISPECQFRYLDIPWRAIVGMRNRIVHAYFDVDLDIIWQVIVEDLPSILPQIAGAIRDLEGDRQRGTEG